MTYVEWHGTMGTCAVVAAVHAKLIRVQFVEGLSLSGMCDAVDMASLILILMAMMAGMVNMDSGW